MTEQSCGSEMTAKKVVLRESESLVRWRATVKSCGSEKTAKRVVLSVSETSSGRRDRTPNAVDKDITRDGLRHCVMGRPGPTGKTWAPRQRRLSNSVCRTLERHEDRVWHCGTGRQGPTGQVWAPRQGAVVEPRMPWTKRSRWTGCDTA